MGIRIAERLWDRTSVRVRGARQQIRRRSGGRPAALRPCAEPLERRRLLSAAVVNGEIPFQRQSHVGQPDFDNEVYTMNPDGSGERSVSNNPRASDWYPAWSPDG